MGLSNMKALTLGCLSTALSKICIPNFAQTGSVYDGLHNKWPKHITYVQRWMTISRHGQRAENEPSEAFCIGLLKIFWKIIDKPAFRKNTQL